MIFLIEKRYMYQIPSTVLAIVGALYYTQNYDDFKRPPWLTYRISAWCYLAECSLSYPFLTYPSQHHEIDRSLVEFQRSSNDDENFGSAIGEVEEAEEVEVDQLDHAWPTYANRCGLRQTFHGEFSDSALVQNEAMKNDGKYARHAVHMWTEMFLD